MILQTHPHLIPEIRTSGCYLMSLLWYANKYGGAILSPDVINTLYSDYLHRRWMLVDCTILDPQAILQHLGVDCRYTDSHEPPGVLCSPYEFEILRWVRGDKSHFTAGDGLGHVTYDPMGESATVRYGQLADKRIFVRAA